MMRAAIENVEPDPDRARDFLAQQRFFWGTATGSPTHAESSGVLYWQACVSAMDAILTAS